jgi:hypothetical protein
VPGHSNIVGNEVADKLAKQATLYPTTISETTSFAFLGIEINRLKKEELSEHLLAQKHSLYQGSYSRLYPWKIARRIALPIGTKRELASSFFQLKIGHGYLKSYLFRLGLASSNKCICGQVENPSHLLLSCLLYKEQRKSLKENMNVRALTLPLLLHTTTGIQSVLGFLKETSIATRRWHLRRAELEELEELEQEAL